MSLDNLKEVEYDDVATNRNYKAVCPYCGYEHDFIGEDYGEQDEEIEQECWNCEKIFIYTTDYTVRFSTEPYENWALRRLDVFKKNIERLEKDIKDDNKKYKDMHELELRFQKNNIEILKKDIERYLGEDK
jgi:uncharacterized Zn finger protein (UPF0148 family)